jgi:signal transduction histidine kinase
MENDIYSEKQKINLNDTLSKHFEFFAEQADSKNLAIEINMKENVTINSNPALTEILISNLFLNAIRHNVSNGKIIISLTNDALTFSNTGGGQALVSDKLFNRFSKSNASEKGNGLGLSIIKKIADIHGWQISYYFFNNLHSFSVNF